MSIDNTFFFFYLIWFKQNLILPCKVCCGRTIPLTCNSINKNTLETVKTLYVYKFTQMHHCLIVGHFNTFTDTFYNMNIKHPGFYHLKTSLWRIAGASQTLSTTYYVQHHLIKFLIFCFQWDFINCTGLWKENDLFIYWKVWSLKHE